MPHQEEMKDIAKLKTNLVYPTTRRKGQIELKTKAKEDKATARAEAKRLEEVAEVIKIENLMTTIGLS